MSGERPVRVVVADRDASTRTGIRMALVQGGFEVCAEATTARSAREAVQRERPDVCLIDTEIEGGGLDAATAITSEAPGTVVVMLGSSADDDRVLAAVRAGARGYLPKDMNPARLGPALRGAVDGEAALPRALMGRVLEELYRRGRYGAELARRQVTLTRREQEVLELLDQNLDTADIARLLGISAVTVRRHVSELLRKLGVRDREAALRLLRARP